MGPLLAAERPPEPACSPRPQQQAVERLAEAVREQVARASTASPGERQAACERLLADVAGAVSPRSRAALEEEGALAPAETSGRGQACFYEVLARHFASGEGAAEAAALLPLFAPTWGLPASSGAFALLLHRWLFAGPPAGGVENAERRKHLGVALRGASQLLLEDLHAGTRNFEPLYRFLFEQASSPEALAALPSDVRPALVGLAARFAPGFFVSDLAAAARALAAAGASRDRVVGEFTALCGILRSEDALVGALDALRVAGPAGVWGADSADGGAARATSRLRLQAQLYALMSPGGPNYSPRPVRHAARRALDALEPTGRRWRTLVHLAFRLFRPSYLPGSLANWAASLLRSAGRLASGKRVE